MPASARQRPLMMATGGRGADRETARGARVPGFPWRLILRRAGGPDHWVIQTRKPYPPTTPTATTGQMKAAMTAKTKKFRAPAGR
jgi:hypothetical protein